MVIKKAEFITSAVNTKGLPSEDLAEFMFCGRSNVGKSSFINMLTNRKSLAKTSANPGKTQTLNVYLINDSFYFVDVPGYGYARVSKTMQAKFGQMVEDYLQNRSVLKKVFLLVDFRHCPTGDDKMMYDYLAYYNIPITIIATKADKVKSGQRNKNIEVIKKFLGLEQDSKIIVTSTFTKEGLTEVLAELEEILVEKN